MELNVIAIDIAKQVFQLHWLDGTTGCIERLRLRRSQVLSWFANREPALVLMEACCGAHEWGRRLLALGHEVRLLSPKSVRPFVQRNKTDAADAQAIWTAGRQPGAKFVAVKTVHQQVVLSLHRLRAQLMKMRIMQTNELRGLLYEFGIVLPEGHRALQKELPAALASAGECLPSMLVQCLQEQVNRISSLDADIAAIERRLAQQLREMPACKTLADIPGIGLLTATAVVASMGSPEAFRDGREFAASIGLAPRQTGTGGRVRQLGISKRGDGYLRTLLMHGARAIVRSSHATSWPWLAELLKRRPYNVTVAAVATSEWVEVTQGEIDLFAVATGDHQWIHVDPARAREGPYGTTIAHGFLTLSLLPKLFATAIRFERQRMAVNYGLNRVRFPAPTPCGSRLRGLIHLQDWEKVAADGVQLTWRMSVEREGQEKPVCIAEFVQRRYW